MNECVDAQLQDGEFPTARPPSEKPSGLRLAPMILADAHIWGVRYTWNLCEFACQLSTGLLWGVVDHALGLVLKDVLT